MGPSRRSVLGLLAGAALVGPAFGAGSRRRLLLVVSSGGWDPTFSIDPKPQILDGGPYPDLEAHDPEDVEEVVRFGDIAVSCNEKRRPHARAFFEKWSERTLVINGLWSGSLSHWTAMDRALTGTDAPGSPDVAAIAGSVQADEVPLGTVDLAGLSRFGELAPKCARAGVRDQLRALLDPSVRLPTPSRSGSDPALASGPRPGWHPSSADRDAIERFLRQRGGRPTGEDEWRDRREARDRAEQLRARLDAVDGLPFGRRTQFADQVPFAVDLLAADLCRTVVVGTGYGWDTHADAWHQHASWDGTFEGLTLLVDSLDGAGLLADTLVVALSEFGRSPTRNAGNGTGHWPYSSAMVIGGEVDGRRVIGATDDGLLGSGVDLATGGPGSEPLGYAEFAAGVLEAVGVESGDWLPGVKALRGMV